MSSCCPKKPKPVQPSCCTGNSPDQASTEYHPAKHSFDWLLWSSATLIITSYFAHLFFAGTLPFSWVESIGSAVFELVNTMWWSMVLAAVFVGILGRIPQHFIVSVLGKGGSWGGLWRATMAGLLLDLCSHGILMVGMQLYQRGASLGQTMAFLIASPWNSLSVTFILIALIGLPWTLAFIALSMLIAIISGYIFEILVTRGTLPKNKNTHDLPDDFQFWHEAKTQIKTVKFSLQFISTMLWEGIKGSRMVLRWLLFGIMLAACIRTFMDLDTFKTLFGPTIAGLGLTLIAATIIEVCSEGSAPIAGELFTRASAPGNGFTFLMTGVATDYTEIMSLKETTHSWKIALFLPLVTVPQVLVFGWILNNI